ncbi:MAG: hypothetical protein QOE63_938, partial [Acidimicrobiaceae bacterium]
FSTRGRRGRTRHYLTGLTLTVLPLVATLAVLGLLAAAGATSMLALTLGLTIASSSAALIRFVLLRRWMQQ